MKTRLPWGESGLELDLPDDWRIIAEARPKGIAACPSVEQEFLLAVSDPAGAAPLRSRDLPVEEKFLAF